MPLAAAIPAVIGAGASIYSASQQSKAASKANKAQQAAAQQQLAAQQANFDRIDAMNQPLVQGRNAAFDQILTRLGVTGAGARPATSQASYGGAAKTPGGSAGTSPLESAGGGADYAAYYAQNPDLQAEYARLEADPASAAQFDTPEQYAAYQAQTFNDRPVPQQAAPAPAPADPNAAPDLMNAQRPDAPQAPQYQRAPGMGAPDLGNFIDPSQFKVDPGYQFRLSEGLGAVNAASAARGKLRSGDAAKALQARGEGLANQGYGDWYNRQLAAFDRTNSQYQYGQGRADNVFADDRAYDTSKWQFDTQRQDQNFNTDRGYQTNRWDTQTGNLFDVVNVGSGAAGQIAGAGTNNANAQSNIFGSQAQSTADAAYAKGAANAGAFGSVAGAAANLFTNWGGGSRPAYQSNVGQVAMPQVSNPFGAARVVY